MIEAIVLGLFVLGLLLCVILDASVLYALIFGWLLFFSYGLYKKRSPRELLSMTWQGVRTVKGLLPVFLLIGVLTGVWRQCGTIACIVYSSAPLIRPEGVVLSAFLLCCLLSLLTGTAFGTVATMGVITATIASAAGADMFWTGGAILAGCFFGDRCSPMSTSALLVSQITETDIYGNIRRMLKTALVPFLLSCAVYALVGFIAPCGTVSPEVRALFSGHFDLHWTTLLPAAAIVILALLRVRVSRAMLVSILLGVGVSAFTQKAGALDILRCCVFGYTAADPALGAMMDGGGLISMINTAAIVCLSSSYAGIFDGTGLLKGLKSGIAGLCGRVTPYGGVMAAAALSCMISCNQTLASILTNQLCADEYQDRAELAITLEDTVIVMAALVPWSIAAAVPLAAVGAPSSSIFAAVFLYLLPVWGFLSYGRRSAAAARAGA